MSPRKKNPGRPFAPRAIPRSDDADAFIPDPDGGPVRIDDELAEILAEEFVEAATSAPDPDEERLGSAFPEEIGGPFIETSADEELADDVDENNPLDATREPVPRAVAGIVAYPRVEEPAEEAQEADDEDDDRDPADPGITAREADPARDVDELNEDTRSGRT